MILALWISVYIFTGIVVSYLSYDASKRGLTVIDTKILSSMSFRPFATDVPMELLGILIMWPIFAFIVIAVAVFAVAYTVIQGVGSGLIWLFKLVSIVRQKLTQPKTVKVPQGHVIAAINDDGVVVGMDTNNLVRSRDWYTKLGYKVGILPERVAWHSYNNRNRVGEPGTPPVEVTQ